jgi:hypothetical protein
MRSVARITAVAVVFCACLLVVRATAAKDEKAIREYLARAEDVLASVSKKPFTDVSKAIERDPKVKFGPDTDKRIGQLVADLHGRQAKLAAITAPASCQEWRDTADHIIILDSLYVLKTYQGLAHGSREKLLEGQDALKRTIQATRQLNAETERLLQ